MSIEGSVAKSARLRRLSVLRSRLGRLVKRALVGGVVVLLVLLGVVFVASHDSAPTTANDILEWGITPAPHEANAFEYWADIGDIMVLPSDRQLFQRFAASPDEMSVSESEEMDRVLFGNGAMLARIGQGIAAGRLGGRMVTELFDDSKRIASWSDCHRILGAQSAYYLRQGDYARSVEIAQLLYAFGSIIAEEPRSMLDLAVGLFCVRQACQAYIRVALDWGCDGETLDTIQRGLETQPRWVAGYRSALVSEYV